MNSQKILKTLGAIVVAIILIYSFIPGDKLSYTETILKHREQTNDFMQHDEESPLPDSLKAEFAGLDGPTGAGAPGLPQYGVAERTPIQQQVRGLRRSAVGRARRAERHALR